MRRRKPFQERFQLCLGFYPHGDIHGFSIPEEQERGNGGNLIALCQVRGFVYVDFSKGNFRMLFRQFFHSSVIIQIIGLVVAEVFKYLQNRP